MTNLVEAYNGACGTLKPQKQGTCGLYSFWFASLLLAAVNPSANKPIIYPRSGEGSGTAGESLRHYVKHTVHTISSDGGSQGEVLSCAEMEQVIRRFGYSYESHIGKGGRQEFITRSLAANRPVMFPYMFGNTGPIYALPVGETGGVDYGPHWSLIYREFGAAYYYIEPNDPNHAVSHLKDVVLRSNSFVDSYKYDRYWSKGGSTDKFGRPLPYDATSEINPVGNTPTSNTYYDIGDKSRQSLNNVLIAVH